MTRIGSHSSPCRYPLDLLPGWTAESVGYHTGDGKLYKGRPRGQPFGPRCEAGDRVVVVEWGVVLLEGGSQ